MYSNDFFKGSTAPWDEKGRAVEDINIKFASKRNEGSIFPNFAGGVFLVIGVYLDDM